MCAIRGLPWPCCSYFPYVEPLRRLLDSPQVARIKEIATAIFAKSASWCEILRRPASEKNIKSTGMLACIYLVVFLCFCIPLIVLVHRVRNKPRRSPPSSPSHSPHH